MNRTDFNEAEHLGYAAGKGVKRVSIFNDGVQVNVATESNQIQKNVEGGGKISVGTTPVEVSFTGSTKSIVITADKDNSGLIFVGKSDVASNGSNALTFLEAGDSITLDYDDVDNALYVVSDTASQNFWKGSTIL